MRRVLIRYLAFIIMLFGITVCSESITEFTPSIDEDNGSQSISSTFSDIQLKIFNQSCALSGCHVNGSVNPDLENNAYNNLVNKISTTGMAYIKSGDPNNSYLLQKVLGSSIISGERMPRNSSALLQEEIDAITKWISEGALNN